MAALCMCIFGFIHVDEVVAPLPLIPIQQPIFALEMSRLTKFYTKPQFLEVCIKVSNTDPFCQGVSVYLNATSSSLCPLAALLHYILNMAPSLALFHTEFKVLCIFWVFVGSDAPIISKMLEISLLATFLKHW